MCTNMKEYQEQCSMEIKESHGRVQLQFHLYKVHKLAKLIKCLQFIFLANL